MSLCWTPRVGVNLPAPLDPSDRCAHRHASRDAATQDCAARGEEACAGVVDDRGMQCPSGFLEFELRAPSSPPEPMDGVIAWVRGAACPPSLSPPSLSPPLPPPHLPIAALLAVGLVAFAGWTACVWRAARVRTFDVLQRDGMTPLRDQL